MFHTLIHPQGAEVTLSIPPEYIGKDLELILFATGEGQLRPEIKRTGRVPGVLKGKLQLAADFDAPLEDFKEYQ